MPSLLTSFSPTSVHTSPFLLKQTACLLPAGTSFSPPLPMTSLLYVSFTPATSCCHLAIFSIYNLKSIFSIFFPPLPGNAFQSLALSTATFIGTGVARSMAFCLLSFWAHGAAFFPVLTCFPCILHRYDLSHYKSDRPIHFLQKSQDVLFSTSGAQVLTACSIQMPFVSFSGFLPLSCKS